MTSPLPKDTAVLAGLFATSGVVHLVRPQVFAPTMPLWVPAHRGVILGSGVVELACAAGLLAPATRRHAGWASAAVLLAVYPANIETARKAARSRSTRFKVLAYGRLPLQLPMLRAAFRVARGH